MFRRWLLSLPGEMTADMKAPRDVSAWNDDNSIILVGKGSLGGHVDDADPRITRAYLTPAGNGGRSAWRVGPENQKARIDLAKKQRELGSDVWETAQGSTGEVGVGGLSGLSPLDSDESISDRLATLESLEPAGIASRVVQDYFFDLTERNRGVLSSVRTGHLKKDLSLLFEKGKDQMPERYRFEPGDLREPSIRPMSSEIAGRAVLPERHFAPWNRMRHFYRMYRQDSDGRAPVYPAGIDGSPGLDWDGGQPWTNANVCTYNTSWWGEDSYYRFPVVTNITFIISLRTVVDTRRGGHQLGYVASPVYVYWNPYNVELRLRDSALVTRTYLTQVQPLFCRFSLGSSLNKQLMMDFDDDYARLRSGVGEEIFFKPGEFRIFTPAPGNVIKGSYLDILPGFDPQSFGGLHEEGSLGNFNESQNPGIEITLCPHAKRGNLWNSQQGATPGSFAPSWMWTPTANFSRRTMPFNIHVDWTNSTEAQAFTPITPAGAPDRWVYDGELLPVGYIQLALKGIHDHDYDTIGWEEDWRCRNWIQSTPFYLGKGLYMSENSSIAHTQRIDCPFEFRFGSLLGSGKDVDDIIQHIGNSALMGPEERVTAASVLELPSAPIGSLAGFSAMRMNPGWVVPPLLNGEWNLNFAPRGRTDTTGFSLHFGGSKPWAYQSGVTGPGIGNSFLHPMIPRDDVYQFLDNSVSMENQDFTGYTPGAFSATDTKAYCDYWDHVFLLNDALWDDYFLSSLADQSRPGASASDSLSQNLAKLEAREPLANVRYLSHFGGRTSEDVRRELEDVDGYLRASAHLMVDGMFNVNSTSVAA